MALSYVELLDKDGSTYRVLTDTIDEESNSVAQVMKPAWGPDTDVNVVDADAPLPTALYNENAEMLAFADPVALTDTFSTGTSAMAQYDCLHTNILTITSAVRNTGSSLNLMGAILRDKSAGTTHSIRAYFFNADPTSSTFTQASALSIHDDDVDKLIGWLDFTDWANLAASSAAKADAADLPAALKVASGTTLYYALQLISNTAPTYASGDLQLNIPYALQD